MGNCKLVHIGGIECTATSPKGTLLGFKAKLSTPGSRIEFYALRLVENTFSTRKLLKRFAANHGVEGLCVAVSNRGRISFRTAQPVATEEDAMQLFIHRFQAAANRQQRLHTQQEREQSAIIRQTVRRRVQIPQMLRPRLG